MLSRTPRGRFLAPLALVAVLALSADAANSFSPLTVAPRQHAPAVIHHLREGLASSTNWSGYAVTGTNVTDVEGSWTVPAVSCPGGSQYASLWIGIDGFNSGSVEQTGTDSDCQNGVPTYYAWFEFYPHPAYMVNNFAVHPGDVISARTNYDPKSRQFTVSLTNVTTGQSFSTSTRVNNARRTSAEWIVEAPWSSGVLPLANFSTAKFGGDYTGVGGTSAATVNGTTGPIGAFGSNVVAITMVSSSNGTKATPSNLSGDGTSFTDWWYSPGP